MVRVVPSLLAVLEGDVDVLLLVLLTPVEGLLVPLVLAGVVMALVALVAVELEAAEAPVTLARAANKLALSNVAQLLLAGTFGS